jgi:hypothetical protein
LTKATDQAMGFDSTEKSLKCRDCDHWRGGEHRWAECAFEGTAVFRYGAACASFIPIPQGAETRSESEGTVCINLIDELRKALPNGHPRFLDICLDEAKLHSEKSHDYSKGGGVFGNFERVAAILQQYPNFPYNTKEGVLIVYMLKQIDAILWGLCQKIEHKVEGLGPRSQDVSVYSKILRIMEEEKVA